MRWSARECREAPIVREKQGSADYQPGRDALIATWERRCVERQIEEEKYLSPRSRHTLVEKKMRCLLNKKGCASIVSREKDALITRVKGGIDREKNIRADCREKKGRADYQGEEGVRWLRRDISYAIHQLEEGIC